MTKPRDSQKSNPPPKKKTKQTRRIVDFAVLADPGKAERKRKER